MNQLPVPTEAQEGLLLVAYLRRRNIPFTHVGNETGQSPEARRRAIRLKQQGTSKGFPDYVLALPGVGVAFIELKRQKGSATSPEQKEWITTLNACPGAEARICRGYDECVAFVEDLYPSNSPYVRKMTDDTLMF